jgi:NAD(P)H-hydrate epimerase
LQALYGGTVLLKSAGTVVASQGSVLDVISGSNPGMATGGMGDVLSGIIGAVLGQIGDGQKAAVLGAAAHLAAADRASEASGLIGLIPTDVIDALPLVFQASERYPEARDL